MAPAVPLPMCINLSFCNPRSPRTRFNVEPYSFSHLPSGYERTRSGQTRIMPDGTIVTLHDTNPDRVFSVIPPEGLRANQPSIVLHAHNQGLWINDFEVYDQDRVIAVTWEGRLVLLNIRSGLIEYSHDLQLLTGARSLYGVEAIHYAHNRLVVESPGADSVAEFRLRPTSQDYSIQMVGLHSNPLPSF